MSGQSGASQATCMLCQPPQVIGAGILNHLRLFHPDEYGDGPEQWPDGGFVIIPEDVETVADVLGEEKPDA